MTGIKIEGLDDLEATLKTFAPRQALNITRGAVQAVATKLAKEIRSNAPRGQAGRLKKAKNIKARRRNVRGDIAISEIQADPRDAFFWRFVEHGTLNTPAQPFVNPAVERQRPKLRAEYEQQIGKRLEKALAKRGR